jgi:glutaconate CoA-transferase subunit B
MRQSPRSFVERLDFKTSVGKRVRVVVTDLGVYHPVDGELQLDALHEGVTLDQVKGAMGWTPRVAAWLAHTPPPSELELRMIREELDPAGVYTK